VNEGDENVKKAAVLFLASKYKGLIDHRPVVKQPFKQPDALITVPQPPGLYGPLL